MCFSSTRAPRRSTLPFRLLGSFLLGEGEALGLFAARGAFFYVVSALAVSHKTFTLTLSRPVPSDFGESKLLILTPYFSWVLRCDV